MTPLEVAAGSTIIQQGDTNATTFYVLAMGCCEVLLQKPEWGKDPRQVLTYDSGRSGTWKQYVWAPLHGILFFDTNAF